MLDKAAVVFWLCWSVALLIGLATRNLRLWLIIGALVGIALGLVAGAVAKRKRKQSY